MTLAQRNDWTDLDICDVQDLLIECGLRVEVPATDQDCTEEWALEYNIQPGDPIHKSTELGKLAWVAYAKREK